MSTSALTTVDNPWNPRTHWNEWNAFDLRKGYNTLGLLARFTYTSDNISEADHDVAVEDAIDRVVELNPFGVHRKIYLEDE